MSSGTAQQLSRTLCTSSRNLADAGTPQTLLELESPSSVGVSQAATEPELHPPGTPPTPSSLSRPWQEVQSSGSAWEVAPVVFSSSVPKVDSWQKSLESQNIDTFRKAFLQGCEHYRAHLIRLDLVVHMALIFMLTSADRGYTEIIKKLLPVVANGKKVL